ncbi:helicase [Bifidobacterium criceti]|uniref:Helicase n=1 Tax=Bifidobacterium criceti TaxID=1960969 RepID=A0A2A2EFB1_9BIFI|nr:helicase [Bifidobacterium criceti]PAU67622.1 helicase [Bifidobacterium criceti]
MADERGSQHHSQGGNRRYGSGNGGQRRNSGGGFRSRDGKRGSNFHRGNQGGSGRNFNRRANGGGRNNDFRRDGEGGEFRRDGDGQQRRFHRNGGSGNGYRSGNRFHGRDDERGGNRRNFRHNDGERRDFRRDGERGGQRRDFRRDDGERRNFRHNDGERRDFRRDDGERRNFRHNDGDRRDFHHDDNDRRDFRGRDGQRGHDGGRHDDRRRNDRSNDRRNPRYNDEGRAAHHDRKRAEYMSHSRRNSDGTVSFPSQNPYTDRRPGEPVMPKGLEWSMLSKDERERLRGLAKEHAENIGLHILAAYTLEANDPQAALAHAKWAAKQASRVDIARETLAMVAYRQGDYKLALREFQTAFRMNGYLDYLPFMADCERGLDKPKKAIEIALSDNAKRLTGEAKAEMFLVYAGALNDMGMTNQAIEVVSKLVHAKGLAGEYRMRAAQAEQYFLSEAGRDDEAVALDELIDDLEARYADVDEEETSDDFVVDYDVEDLPEDLQAKLGVTPDDAQYAPLDDEDGVNMDDETRIPEEEQRAGAEMDIDPAQMQERNSRRDEEGVMGDPDLTDAEDDANEEDVEVGDYEEQLKSETE